MCSTWISPSDCPEKRSLTLTSTSHAPRVDSGLEVHSQLDHLQPFSPRARSLYQCWPTVANRFRAVVPFPATSLIAPRPALGRSLALDPRPGSARIRSSSGVPSLGFATAGQSHETRGPTEGDRDARGTVLDPPGFFMATGDRSLCRNCRRPLQDRPPGQRRRSLGSWEPERARVSCPAM